MYKDQTSEFMNSRPLSLCMVLELAIIANNASSMESGSPKHLQKYKCKTKNAYF